MAAETCGPECQNCDCAGHRAVRTMQAALPAEQAQHASATEPESTLSVQDFARLRFAARDQELVDKSEREREDFYVEAHTDGFTCLARLVEYLMLTQDRFRANNKLQTVLKELISAQTQAQLRAKAAEAPADHWSSNPLWRVLLKLCNETIEEMNICERERRQDDQERRAQREKLLWGDMIRDALSPSTDPYARSPDAKFEPRSNQAAVNMMRQAVQGMGALYQEHMA